MRYAVRAGNLLVFRERSRILVFWAAIRIPRKVTKLPVVSWSQEEPTKGLRNGLLCRLDRCGFAIRNWA